MSPSCQYIYGLLDREPSVGDLMDLCEESYGLLMKMAPELAAMTGRHGSNLASHPDLVLEIVEQSRYTTLVHLTHQFGTWPRRESDPDALLRVYHDAQQVEVVDLRQRVLPPERLYCAPGLSNRWRANLFISRWLAFCARLGHRFPLERCQEAPAGAFV
jgi:uncharacterized protein YqiB (DUF1249 family)